MGMEVEPKLRIACHHVAAKPFGDIGVEEQMFSRSVRPMSFIAENGNIVSLDGNVIETHYPQTYWSGY